MKYGSPTAISICIAGIQKPAVVSQLGKWNILICIKHRDVRMLLKAEGFAAPGYVSASAVATAFV